MNRDTVFIALGLTELWIVSMYMFIPVNRFVLNGPLSVILERPIYSMNILS